MNILYKSIPRIIIIVGILVFGAIGFNTLDWMVNTFAWSEPVYPGYLWWMNTWYALDWWDAYMLFGIIFFGIGCVCTGFLIRDVLEMVK